MKYINLILIPIILISTCVEKPAGKYADLKKYLNEMADFQNKSIKSLKNADTAGEVAESINAMTDRMYSLAIKGIKLKKKYPDLDIDSGRIEISDLKSEIKKIEKLKYEVLESRKVIMKYLNNQKVKDALMKQRVKLKELYEKQKK